MTEIIRQYLKECEEKRFELYHNEYEFDDLELKIKIVAAKEILKRIEVKK